MKRFVVILLAIALTLTFAGCSSEQASGKSEQTSEKKEKLTVGIIQLVDNGAFEDMRNGFISRLRELGYTEDQLEIHYKNAQGDMTNLNSICQEMVNSGVDLVATIATPASQAMVNMQSDIPVIFIAVSNPEGAGIINDMDVAPDKNATGTSNAIPVGKMFQMAKNLTPDVKTYGLLYNTGEVNSVTTIKNAKKYLEENGYQYEEAVVTNSSEVQQSVQSLVNKVDAIFVPNDSVIQSAMSQVAEIAKKAKIPVYGSSNVMVESGAFATISISDEKIGAMSANMADQYFKGTPIEKIPAITLSEFDTIINQETAKAIDVELSQEILDTAVMIEKTTQQSNDS